MANITSPNRRFIIAKNLIMMLVVLVVGLLAVWSWFTVNQQVQANNIKVEAAHPNKIGLAKVIKYYDRNNSSNTKEGPDVFTDTLSFSTADFKFTKDCTGDAKTLIVPDFSVTKDRDEATKKGRIVNTNGVWEQALSNNDVAQVLARSPEDNVEARYMELEFYARSKGRVIRIASSSFLKSETEVNGGSLSTAITDNNDPKKSSYGPFNVDALVGAIRVGLVAQGASNVSQTIESDKIRSISGVPQTSATLGQEEPTLIWVARPDIWLNTTTSTNDWTIETGVQENTVVGNEHIGEKSYSNEYYAPKDSTVTTDTYNTKLTQNITTSGTTVDGIDSSIIFGVCFNNGAVGNTYNIDGNVSKKSGTGVTLQTTDSKVLVSDQDTCPNLGKDKDVSELSYRDNLQTSSLPRSNIAGDNDNYYVYKYKLRIWIEGTDNEARRAMDGGKFNLRLEFK